MGPTPPPALAARRPLPVRQRDRLGLLANPGRGDWVVNALLFAGYHLHEPWSMPSAFTTGLVQAYATRRWQSAWLGIITHSAQSVFFTVILVRLVNS